ncbi:hypothetical protein N0V93_003981 [Gnomoniopsis smithogilvyi]|uniref:Uncharacterized protein n=1 Tax=Gnomoniopsis smithogilvyi TaxID=1191159 RepID=A0A9W8YZJ3_9PEZI|nr:hypothetical protein N0V93_003981 [Gnomoniopsis smithogilvyi]
MLVSSFLSALAFAATALASPVSRNSSTPAAPATKYLFTANILSDAPIELGETPAGQRAFQTISGGTFSGPELQGKVVGGLDHGLVDADGYFDPNVVYLLQTSDACNILVREKGHAPNVLLLFETACDKYDWLNGVVAYGLAAQVTGGISVEVFKVGVYED